MKNRYANKARFANLFAGMGYIVLIVQWTLSVAFFVPSLQVLFPIMTTQEPVEQIASSAESGYSTDVWTFAVSVVVVFIVVVVTLLVVAKLPLAMARTGKKAIKRSSAAVTDVVVRARHKKSSKSFRIKIQPKIAFGLRILAVLIPVGLAYMTWLLPVVGIHPFVAIFVTVFMGDVAMVLFILQHVVGHAMKVPLKYLWL